jgi:hypothetical protein
LTNHRLIGESGDWAIVVERRTVSSRSRLCEDRIYEDLLWLGSMGFLNAIVPVQKGT